MTIPEIILMTVVIIVTVANLHMASRAPKIGGVRWRLIHREVPDQLLPSFNKVLEVQVHGKWFLVEEVITDDNDRPLSKEDIRDASRRRFDRLTARQPVKS
jgi:hypothetical protein